MKAIDIMIATTWDASTSYIPLPSGCADIASIPTTQYLVGTDQVMQVAVRKNTDTGVQINYQAVKYNVLKLQYIAVGELVRT